ncbi:leucine-rich repeat receptor-like protein kinase TDR [Cucurbita moschata]|uniref:non-specific serine/threonine protein kinase n=1 Tax=Cucurbita moschata TaxID=3662 RepID=A0A6J1HCI0_CUCMO|nr:leucine-rich repeat receptor-like protein kinase TDR [Cucurbita moschata]
MVAVKRIWNSRKSDHKLEKEFMAEVEILSSIRHNNIIKLLCCVSCESSRLLVYEYMEKQSLDKWLHNKNSLPRIAGSGAVRGVALNWPMRFQIAVGVAQGLCYMHHECSPSVIHRDLKSSNILLDSEFNAKIADFGLAKLLVKQGEPASISAVAGSFGYMAPEYAQIPRINEKIDVFSFGVILLELVTGKEALTGVEDSSLAMWAWEFIKQGKAIVEALDEDVKETRYLDEMCSVFKLGLICTSSAPTSRPSMNQALQILVRSRTMAPQNHADQKVQTR